MAFDQNATPFQWRRPNISLYNFFSTIKHTTPAKPPRWWHRPAVPLKCESMSHVRGAFPRAGVFSARLMLLTRRFLFSLREPLDKSVQIFGAFEERFHRYPLILTVGAYLVAGESRVTVGRDSCIAQMPAIR